MAQPFVDAAAESEGEAEMIPFPARIATRDATMSAAEEERPEPAGTFPEIRRLRERGRREDEEKYRSRRVCEKGKIRGEGSV